ncbi:hypothetical protein ACJJI5_00730 [Microbulbifer sp. EKSA008]|uniref:hypothetical protein n=1 Tax=Microbulbifer sp. EKSA008 TaxID=3243367 RepID=UPI0040437DB5
MYIEAALYLWFRQIKKSPNVVQDTKAVKERVMGDVRLKLLPAEPERFIDMLDQHIRK